VGSSLIQNPVFQTVVAPFTVALILAAVLRLVGGSGCGAAIMGIAIAVGFLVGYGLFEGVPSFPPLASKQKVFYLAALGGLVGLALDLKGSQITSTNKRYTMRLIKNLIIGVLCWFAMGAAQAG